MNKFHIYVNNYLKKGVDGFYNRAFSGFNNENNPDELNHLKNTFNNADIDILNKARAFVTEEAKIDLPQIMEEVGYEDAICVLMPRAKSLATYSSEQRGFERGIQKAIEYVSNLEDGTSVIERVKDTKTTHINASIEGFLNDGSEPYIGITKDTCKIDENRIKDRNVILVDDVYTLGVDINEDCIEALWSVGAKNITYYCIGKTERRNENI